MTLQEFYPMVGGDYAATLGRLPSEALEKADLARNPNALAETRAAGYDIIDSAKKLQEFYLRKDKEAAHAN